MSHKSYWGKVFLSAYKASNLFFNLQTASIKSILLWVSSSSFGLYQSWVHPFAASNCPEQRPWQDIHHWELKVLVEPETRRCLDLSSAHVNTIWNLMNLRQTCTLVEVLFASPMAVFAKGLCAHILLSSTDLSSLIHVHQSLISYQPCRSNIQRRLQAILGSWKAHAFLD